MPSAGTKFAGGSAAGDRTTIGYSAGDAAGAWASDAPLETDETCCSGIWSITTRCSSPTDTTVAQGASSKNATTARRLASGVVRWMATMSTDSSASFATPRGSGRALRASMSALNPRGSAPLKPLTTFDQWCVESSRYTASRVAYGMRK